MCFHHHHQCGLVYEETNRHERRVDRYWREHLRALRVFLCVCVHVLDVLEFRIIERFGIAGLSHKTININITHGGNCQIGFISALVR